MFMSGFGGAYAPPKPDMNGLSLEREPVDVGLVVLEAQPLIELVGGLTRRATGEADVLRTAPPGFVERRRAERCAHALAAHGPVDDDVLDPRLETGRDPVEGERQAAHDAAVDAGEIEHGIGR